MVEPKTQMKGRITRIILGSLLPAVFAVIYLALESTELPPIKELAVVLLIGYVMTGFQAIVASLLMEFIVNPRWGYPTAIGVGAVLGLVGIALFAPVPKLLVMGALIGTLMGWLLHSHYRRSTRIEQRVA